MSTVHLTISDSVATLELARPEALNATNLDLAIELGEALRSCEKDSSIGSVVLAGQGRSFCAGIDLTALADGRLPDQFYTEWDMSLWQAERLRKPVVAAIHGYCVGAGLQLALTADVRFSSVGARFAMPAAAEGLVPGLGIHRLPRLIGIGPARRMILFGETWSAQRCATVGLVDEVVLDPPFGQISFDSAEHNDEQSRDSTVKRAQAFARSTQEIGGTNGFAVCKELLSLQNQAPADLFGEYLELQVRCRQHPDHLQALDAWSRRGVGAVVR